MLKAIKKFFKKEKTLEDKVKEKYKLSEYELHRQRAMFNYRRDDNKYKSNDEFLNYILVFGLLTDYTKEESLNNSYVKFDSSDSSDTYTNSSYDSCSCSSCSSSSD